MIAGVADALKVPVQTVNTAARHLREHKLLTTGPRGPGAPEMSPVDMTNLVLALMFDDDLKNVHINVPALRAAPIVNIYGRKYAQGGRRIDDKPPHRFLWNYEGTELAPLGEVMDVIFDWQVRYGTLDDTDEEAIEAAGYTQEQVERGEFDASLYQYADNFSLSVARPTDTVTIHLDDFLVYWTLTYKIPRPELEAKADEAAIAMGLPPDGKRQLPDGFTFSLRPRPDSFLSPYMTTTREIGPDSLSALGDVLRGGELEDDDPAEIVPPYIDAYDLDEGTA